MNDDTDRHTIPNVDKLSFGPHSDIYSQALSIVLTYMGLGIDYPEILCVSGRGFMTSWSSEKYFMDDSTEDPVAYLRGEYETAILALERLGLHGELRVHNKHRAARHPPASAHDLRHAVVASIKANRPVVAHLSASSTRWAPEWSLITGYENGGATILGWSCFQADSREQQELYFSLEGYFKKDGWERDTLATVCIVGDLTMAQNTEYDVLSRAIALSQSAVGQREARGFSAYDAWGRSIEDADNETIGGKALTRRMLYYRDFVGHIAAQKWYTSVYLRQLNHTPFSIGPISLAAGHYAQIHELMWDCWRIAGGYWRNTDQEVDKFRRRETRQAIGDLVRQAAKLDEEAVSNLQSAAGVLCKTHAYYLNT